MNFQDKTLTCRDCGQEFTWTAGEQEFYASRQFDNAPTRCPACRAKHKSARQGGGFGGGFRGGDRGPRQMHPAVCAECGKDTEVPFKPTGEKPVYCRECFSKQNNRGGDDRMAA